MKQRPLGYEPSFYGEYGVYSIKNGSQKSINAIDAMEIVTKIVTKLSGDVAELILDLYSFNIKDYIMTENKTIRWEKAIQESISMDGTVDGDSPCTVILNQDRMIVSYQCASDKITYEYSGPNNGNGHFNLTCSQLGATAHLHMHTYEDGHKCLIGEYIEEGYDGFWKIRLEGEMVIHQS